MQTIVQKVLEKMGPLSKPQIKVMVQLVITIMLLCGKVNYTNLSRYSPLNEKTYRRFFPNPLIFVGLIKY